MPLKFVLSVQCALFLETPSKEGNWKTFISSCGEVWCYSWTNGRHSRSSVSGSTLSQPGWGCWIPWIGPAVRRSSLKHTVIIIFQHFTECSVFDCMFSWMIIFTYNPARPCLNPGGVRNVNTIALPAKDDLLQSLSYVASWNGGPCCLDSYGWLRGERRACHNKVITHPAGLKVPVWQLWLVSIATDCQQWPWLGFCQNRTSLVTLWLDTLILCLTSIFRSSPSHLFRDDLWVELL